MYIETKIKYGKTQENGINKEVVEAYIIDALSFTEAEKRIIEEMKYYISGGDYDVAAVAKRNYTEVWSSNIGEDDTWYKVRVAYIIAIDEKTGTEKYSHQNMLVQASSLEKAVSHTNERMKGTLGDWKFISVQETKIMDVFFYECKTNDGHDETDG